MICKVRSRAERPKVITDRTSSPRRRAALAAVRELGLAHGVSWWKALYALHGADRLDEIGTPELEAATR